MNELYWKISFLIVFIIWFFIRVMYSRIAMKNKPKKKVRPCFEKFLVFLNFIGMVFLPLFIVFSNLLDSFKINLSDYIRWIALVISILNLWLFAKTHIDLGKNWSPILEIKKKHKLVQEGIYKRIRHPMYTHIWLWIIGQGIILDNWVILIFGIIAWAVLYFIRVPKEEEMLIKEFGKEYNEYMKSLSN